MCPTYPGLIVCVSIVFVEHQFQWWRRIHLPPNQSLLSRKVSEIKVDTEPQESPRPVKTLWWCELLLMFLNLSLYWKTIYFHTFNTFPFFSFFFGGGGRGGIYCSSRAVPTVLVLSTIYVVLRKPKSSSASCFYFGFLASFWCCFINYCVNFWWQNNNNNNKTETWSLWSCYVWYVFCVCFSAVGRSEGSLFAQPEATFVKEV